MKVYRLILFFLMLIPCIGIGQDKEFEFRQGSLLFSKYQVYFPELRTNEIGIDSIKVKNDSSKEIKIGFSNVVSHLKLRSVPNLIAPGGVGMIYIEYDGSKKNDIGMINEGIYLSTNDSISPKKELSLACNLLTYFPPEMFLKDAILPKAEFDMEEFNYGTIKSGTKIEHSFILKNKGKTNLEILKVKADCGCTVPESAQNIIPPGQQTEIKIAFDSEGKSGIDLRRVMVILNDPHKHQVYLYLNGIINYQE